MAPLIKDLLKEELMPLPNIKKCRQCGEVRDINQFRPYYGGRPGTYSICRCCEQINSRRKYLESKKASGKASEADLTELATILQIYTYQRLRGDRPPKLRNRANVEALLQTYLNKGPIPDELQQWLDAELTEVPDYYLGIYEDLLVKYRPMIRLDKDTLIPVYDSTYADILTKILNRFNQYEDNYYKGT